MAKVTGQRKTVARIKRTVSAAVGIVDEAGLQKLLLARVKARFEQTVSPDGIPWPSLDPSTIRRKTQLGLTRPSQPLWGKGTLYQSINIIRGSSAGLLAGSTGAGFRIGVKDVGRDPRPGALAPHEYGRIHNYGLGVVQRQFMGLSPADVASVAGYLKRRLKSIARG